jgi:filamentous hemagglutinin family protein
MKPCTTLPLLTLTLVVISHSAWAEITLDGSLGHAGALPGPNYQIGADLGQQHGGNLFHSFRDFNLQSHESATFSGPAKVQNVISRVTGGNPSNIDGTIRSTIPNADMYFLNPSGILFGPNARLDVSGSFHASTAHTLKLQDGGEFNARTPAQSVLTVAPIASFGFLDEKIAAISVTGRGEISLTEAANYSPGLQVPVGKTLSLIGGNLEIKNGTYAQQETVDEASRKYPITRFPLLQAPQGQINLVGVATAGEVVPGPASLNVSPLMKFANLTIAEHSLLSVSGDGAGSIFLRGGQIVVTGSEFQATTLGSQRGGVIDIQANYLSLLGGAILRGNTEGRGKGTDIFANVTKDLTVTGESSYAEHSGIFTRSGRYDTLTAPDLGEGGRISLTAQNIFVMAGGVISGSTYGGGHGGGITLTASEEVAVSGNIIGGTYHDQAGAGKAGNLDIKARNISVKEVGRIGSDTYGMGNGGKVTLEASEEISVSGNSSLKDSTISANTYSIQEGAGEAGSLDIKARNMSVKGRAQISSSSFGTGKGGEIILTALENVLLTDGAGVYTTASGSGKGGNIKLQTAGNITLRGTRTSGWSSIIACDSAPLTPGVVGGQAGNIVLEAGELVLQDGAQISNSSIAYPEMHSGPAGTITLHVRGATKLSGVNPYGENYAGFGSGIYARSLGLGDNVGQGGNLNLETESLTLTDGAVIQSSTNNQATGGNLELRVTGTVQITGDASAIALSPPAESQIQYLQGLPPSVTYSQSISGIYVRSEGVNAQSGAGGHVKLHAQNLMMSGGKISASSAGGGRAGEILLAVDRLQLEKGSVISSASKLETQVNFSTLADRDNHTVLIGDKIVITNSGDGKPEHYVYLDNLLLSIIPVTTVADQAALGKLKDQHHMAEGDIVTVTDLDGHGKAGRFILAKTNYDMDSLEALYQFVPINDQNTITIPNLAELDKIKAPIKPGDSLPYSEGTIIKVVEAGYSKPTEFVYNHTRYSGGEDRGNLTRISQFTLDNSAALSDLTKQTELKVGDLALVTAGTSLPATFIYNHDHNWLNLNVNKTHQIADFAAQKNLSYLQPGYIAQVSDAGQGRAADFVYTGQPEHPWIPWRPLGTVANLEQRSALSPQEGDMVTVTKTEAGQRQTFFFHDGIWNTATRGGDAGTIILQVAGPISLSQNSAITTEAKGAGGGRIKLETNQPLQLTQSNLSTSVQDGTGNGGDVTIKAKFVILENGKIIARANEGNGGNLNITTTGVYRFPPPAASPIDATSKKGVNGVVTIQAPDSDVSGQLLALPNKVSSTEEQLKKPCSAQDQTSSFTLSNGDGTPTRPNDFQPSGPLLTKPKSVKVTTPVKRRHQPTQKPLPAKVAKRTACSKP